MPELPEVETVVRQLAEEIPGHRISRVEVIHPDLLSEPGDGFTECLRGARFDAATRRGKNIVFILSGPEGRRDSSFLVVNLGMTGQLLLFSRVSSRRLWEEGRGPSHPGVVLSLEPLSTLVYADVRRFGSLRLFSPEEWGAESDRLGPEPLDPDLTEARFHAGLSASRSPIRSWLLDQTRIAGIGNIYAAEALFRAGVHPLRSARSLGLKEAKHLLDAIRTVLSEAISARGTTLRDFRTASGDYGGFGPFLEAYGREGEPCVRCNTRIERIVFGNRSTFFCPICQENR